MGSIHRGTKTKSTMTSTITLCMSGKKQTFNLKDLAKQLERTGDDIPPLTVYQKKRVQTAYAKTQESHVQKKDVQKMIDSLHTFWKCSDWQKCMQDSTVSQGNKFLLNGVRHIYGSYIATQLEKNDPLVRALPTGSTNFDSDIDMQVLVNLCASTAVTSKKYKTLLECVLYILEEGVAMWSGDIIPNYEDEIPKLLDINIYPPGLINYYDGGEKCSLAYGDTFIYKNDKCEQESDKINDALCFHPVLTTSDLREAFVQQELVNLKKELKSNYREYYKRYKETIIPAMIELISGCQSGATCLEPPEVNNLLFEVVKWNHIGPEMYLTISSILFVVWHMQMKQDIPENDLKVLAIAAHLENKQLYESTAKQKYKDRMNEAAKHMDQELKKKVIDAIDFVRYTV